MSDRPIDKVNRPEFEKWIVDEFLGVPYRNCGRDKAGIDCWGLGLRVYEKLGIKLFDLPEMAYDVNWSKKGGNYLAENLWRDWEKVEQPEFLDVILLTSAKGITNHGGIVLSNGRFIHATMYGVIVSRLTDAGIPERIEGFYRLKRLYGKH